MSFEENNNLYKFYSDWIKLIDKSKSSDKSDDKFKYNLDLSEIRQMWKTLPNGVVEIPVNLDDNKDDVFYLKINKTTNECPFKDNIVTFTIDDFQFE